MRDLLKCILDTQMLNFLLLLLEQYKILCSHSPLPLWELIWKEAGDSFQGSIYENVLSSYHAVIHHFTRSVRFFPA